MAGGDEFFIPFIAFFHEGRTYGQPEVVPISLPQVATGLRSRLPGSFRRRGFQPDLLCRRRHSSPEGRIPCRLLCAQGTPYAEGVPAILLFLKLKAMLPEIYAGCAERGNPDMAIFSLHNQNSRTGSKGKSVVSASAYLNGDVMKNEETGRISYYTSKKKWSTPV